MGSGGSELEHESQSSVESSIVAKSRRDEMAPNLLVLRDLVGAVFTEQFRQDPIAFARDLFHRGTPLAFVALFDVAGLEAGEGGFRVAKRIAGVPEAPNRRAERVERRRTGTHEPIDEYVVHAPKDEPLGPTRSADECAEEIRVESFRAESFGRSRTGAHDEISRGSCAGQMNGFLGANYILV